jgi:hypothetical protein
VTFDTRPSVSITKPDITAGWPESKLSQYYMLQMASGETLPTLKEALVELTLGLSLILIYVTVTKIMDEFILGVDILHTCVMHSWILATTCCNWVRKKYHS